MSCACRGWFALVLSSMPVGSLGFFSWTVKPWNFVKTLCYALFVTFLLFHRFFLLLFAMPLRPPIVDYARNAWFF